MLAFTEPEDIAPSVQWLAPQLRGAAARGPLLKRYLRPDGTIVEALVCAVLRVPDDGDPYFFSQMQDVTDEETGLIVPIGSWVLEAACAQLARWPERIHVSANVSALQMRPALVEEVKQLLARHRIMPGRLVLEITESLVLDPLIKPVIAGLRALGVPLALDDFGTGYSSLGSLQRFPLDVVKLDRSLASSLSDGRGVAVVRAAVELGRALGVPVIAEGIEGRAQLESLRELGCPLGQGFLLAKPLPLADAERLLESPETLVWEAGERAA